MKRMGCTSLIRIRDFRFLDCNQNMKWGHTSQIDYKVIRILRRPPYLPALTYYTIFNSIWLLVWSIFNIPRFRVQQRGQFVKYDGCYIYYKRYSPFRNSRFTLYWVSVVLFLVCFSRLVLSIDSNLYMSDVDIGRVLYIISWSIKTSYCPICVYFKFHVFVSDLYKQLFYLRLKVFPFYNFVLVFADHAIKLNLKKNWIIDLLLKIRCFKNILFLGGQCTLCIYLNLCWILYDDVYIKKCFTLKRKQGFKSNYTDSISQVNK